jgi:hypothetical protein
MIWQSLSGVINIQMNFRNAVWHQAVRYVRSEAKRVRQTLGDASGFCHCLQGLRQFTQQSPSDTLADVTAPIDQPRFQACGKPVTQADFTYHITPNTIAIVDTTLGKRSVTKDIEAVLRKIEYWHQVSIAAFKIMYRDLNGVWDGVRWDGLHPSFLALGETDEGKAMAKLLEAN